VNVSPPAGTPVVLTEKLPVLLVTVNDPDTAVKSPLTDVPLVMVQYITPPSLVKVVVTLKVVDEFFTMLVGCDTNV